MRRVLIAAGVLGCSKNTFIAATPAQTFQAIQKSGALPTLDVSNTIGGTDANNNGVRDDLDQYIASLSDTTAEKNSLTQVAQAIQASMLVDPTNATKTAAVSTSINRAVTCVWSVYPKGMQGQKVATTPCVLGYTVGFFNGVGNTEVDADSGREAIVEATRESLGVTTDTYLQEDISYQTFYNHTGNTVGASTLQDVAEVFVQRANELDSTGYFATNGFSLFWEELTPGNLFMSTLNQSNPFQSFINNFQNAAITTIVADLSAALSQPPTAADYAQQNTDLDTLAAAGRKFVLTAHSQGNLFVNQGYDHIMPVVGSNRVKAVHIAPASPTIRGQYLLSSNDLIINPLRLQGGNATVQANNITIPLSTTDPSGHTLVATYLDASRNGRAATEQLISNAFSTFTTANCAVSISPTGATIKPSQVIALTATTNPPPMDSALNVEYSWSITGTAGGTFPNGASTLNTSAATVNYMASASAASGQIETVAVKVLVAAKAGDYINVETLGTAAATLTIGGGGLQNGDFSQGLAFWSPLPASLVTTANSVSYGCNALAAGAPFAIESTYGSDVSLDQQFTVPLVANTLSLVTWNNLDPVQVTVSVIDATGKETVLGTLQPPSMQKLSDPNNYYSVVCTGNAPASLTYPITQFQGKVVTLRLRSQYIGGINGTFASFANVVVQ